MAGFVDVCSLVLTSAFFIGVILGTALVAQKCQALIDATKASLEERGWIVSRAHPSSDGAPGAGGKGSVVVVKTGKKRMDHERYLDATQRGVIKALNASTFGAPSSQSQQPSQTTTGNASAASAQAAAGPSSSGSSSFGGLSSTFAHFRSQLLLPPLAPPTQPDQLGSASASASASGRGGGGGASGVGAGATSADPGPGRGGTRDSLYDMADRLSTWPSEKVEKVKRLRDQFLSKV